MSKKAIQLHVHLINGKVFVIYSQIQQAIAQIKWARRSGEALEWPEGENKVMTIFPEMILGYSVLYEEAKVKVQPKEKSA